MTSYRVIVSADKWPTTYNVNATNWAAAIGRGLRLWKSKESKGSRTEKLTVTAYKMRALPTGEVDNNQ